MKRARDLAGLWASGRLGQFRQGATNSCSASGPSTSRPALFEPGAIERRIQSVRSTVARCGLTRPHPLDAAAPPDAWPCASADRRPTSDAARMCASVERLARGVDAVHVHAGLTQPRSRRGQSQRLATQVIGRNQERAHSYIVPRYPCRRCRTPDSSDTRAGCPRSSSPRCGSASATTACARFLILYMVAPRGLRRAGILRRGCRPPSTAPTPAAHGALAILGGIVADRLPRSVPQRARSAASSSRSGTSRSRSRRCPSSTPASHSSRSAPACSSRTSAPWSGRSTSRRTRGAMPASRSSTWASTWAPSWAR